MIRAHGRWYWVLGRTIYARAWAIWCYWHGRIECVWPEDVEEVDLGALPPEIRMLP